MYVIKFFDITKYLNEYKIISFSLMLFLLITNNYYTNLESLQNGFTDINTYLKIYNIIIKLKHENNISIYHLERWPIHLIIGYLNEILGIKNIYLLYLFFNIIILIFIILIVEKIKTRLLNKITILSLIFFNPYIARMYICNPVAIADFLFIYSTLLLTIGFINKNNYYILISTLLGLLTKQTSIIFIPILVIYYFQNIIQKNILILSTLMILIWQIVNRIFITRFINNAESNYFDLILKGWEINDNSYELYLDFFLRLILLLLTLSSLLIFQFNKNKINIFIFLISITQPILFGPNITGNNIERLAALGIPFLIPIIIQERNFNKNKFVIFLISNVIISFHHHFSVLTNITIGKYVYGFFIVLSTVILIIFSQTNYILKYNKSL